MLSFKNLLSCQLLKEASEISGKGEFVYGVSPCLAALKANRRKIHAIYMKPGDAQLQGTVKAYVIILGIIPTVLLHLIYT